MQETLNLLREIKSLPKNSVFLILAKSTEYVKVSIELLNYFVNTQKILGIYITVNKPYQNLVKILEENKIDTKKLFFIDLITQTAGGKTEETENSFFVSSPANLTEVGIAFQKATEALKTKEKFVFFDSLSTLLIYNSIVNVAKFSHFIINKIKLSEFSGIFQSLEKETDERLISQISQFVDKVIEV